MFIKQKLTVGHQDRNYLFYTPENLPNGAPLVFVLHGFTGGSQSIMETTHMNLIADEYQFAVCYPQGTETDKKETYWEVGYDFTKKYQADDVRFLTTLARHLQTEFNLSQSDTFVTGMSNGADMSILLGLKAFDVFKAIAPVCGSIMEATYKTCRETPLIPALFINSTNDTVTHWEGDMENKDGWGAYLPTTALIQYFTDKDKGLLLRSEKLPDTNPDDGSYIIADKYENKITGNRLWFYRVIGGGHDWPGNSGNKDIDASLEIWKFFSLFVTK